MSAQACIESIQREASRHRAMATKSRKYKQAARDWQACLEVASEIYHSGAPDAEERIKALKLSMY